MNINRNTIKILWFWVFISAVFSVSAFRAEAANLYFSPSSGNYAQDQNFTVSVLLNAGQQANAVRGVVLFPTEYIDVISVNYNDTIVDLWVRKPSFSNSGVTGNVIFEGVILNPGFTGSGGKVVKIVFRVKKQGSASVKITDFAVLANDGLGTNIAVAGSDADFAFTKPLPQAQNKSTEETLNTIGERIKKIEDQTKLLPFIQETNFYHRVSNLWGILPLWLKFITVIFIGIAVMLLLLIAGLVIVVIIWIGNHIRYRPQYIKIFIRKLWAFIGMAEKEIAGDIAYGRLKFEENYHSATQNISLKMMLWGYFSRIFSVIKRFFTINTKSQDETSENKELSKDSEDKINNDSF